MFVVRCRYVQPDGVGYLDANSNCTYYLKNAQKFNSEAEAWGFAITSGEMGRDEQGEYCWVEPVDTQQ